MKSLVAAASIALSVCAGGASAATLTATTAGPNTSFVINFNDTNGNNLFDLDELVSFSGFHSVFNQTIVSILAVPEIVGITVAGYKPSFTYEIPPLSWYFEENGNVDGKWDLMSGIGNWEYKLDFAAPVPLPASLPLMAAGLGAIAFLRRRKQA